MLLDLESSQQYDEGLPLLGETLQGARGQFNMYELILARWLLDRVKKIQREKRKEVELYSSVDRNKKKD